MNENSTSAIVNRMRIFMEYLGLTITQFADATGIERPSMSQILGGRNKKISVITISKIHTAYPNLSSNWLLYGEGDMLMEANNENSATHTLSSSETSTEDADIIFPSLFDVESRANVSESSEKLEYAKENVSNLGVKTPHDTDKEVVTLDKSLTETGLNRELKNRQIEKIMVFYSDNTYESFSPDRFDPK